MQKTFDLIIFDLDGTLIDNRVAIRENFNHALSLFGYSPLPNSRIDSMIGTPLLEMFERILPEHDKHLASQMVTEYRIRYSNTSHHGVVVLGEVIPALVYLKEAGFKLAVATTKADNEAHSLLQKIGLYNYFDVVTGFRDGVRVKPHPDMIHYILKELAIEPSKTALVGDTPTDVFTAKNASVASIVVTSGVSLGMTTLEKIHESKPDMIISSLAELKNILVK